MTEDTRKTLWFVLKTLVRVVFIPTAFFLGMLFAKVCSFIGKLQL